jgi:uncharacterized NAD-dependent epimerase/dehydratase family protein
MASIGDVMDLHLSLMKNFKQSRFLGMNLLTLKMDEDTALKEIKNLENEHKLPTTDLVRFGDGNLIDRIEQELR